MLLTRKFRPCH